MKVIGWGLVFLASMALGTQGFEAELAPNQFVFERNLTGPLIPVNGSLESTAEKALQQYRENFPEAWAADYRAEVKREIGKRIIVREVEVERGADEVQAVREEGSEPVALYGVARVRVKVTVDTLFQVYKMNWSKKVENRGRTSETSPTLRTATANQALIGYMQKVKAFGDSEQAKYQGNPDTVLLWVDSWANHPLPQVRSLVSVAADTARPVTTWEVAFEASNLGSWLVHR